jgi:hypothetical protein
VERVTEARRLAILTRDVSKVLVDLGRPPILGIPQDPSIAGDVLEQWVSSWSACERPMPLATTPGIRRHPFPIAASSGRPTLVLCFSRLRTLGL